jgi:RNA polymerase sigma-70 factor, ECF subfamily
MIRRWDWQNGAVTTRSEATTPVDNAPGTGAEDLAWLRAGQQGDRTALEHLLKRHEPDLFRLCCGVLPSHTDAEDAVQEAFLRALKAIARPGGFRGDSSVRTWLYRIAIHVCWDWKRKRGNHHLSLTHDLRNESPGPERVTLDRLRLREAFSHLTPHHRALLVLREVEEWSIAEIAVMLGWNEKRVSNELYGARRALARWRERENE